MIHLARTQREDAEWALVSERNRCPICDAEEGCRRHLEGAFACCTRRSSDWPLTNGAWLHRVVTVVVASEHAPASVRAVTAAERAERAAPGSTL